MVTFISMIWQRLVKWVYNMLMDLTDAFCRYCNHRVYFEPEMLVTDSGFTVHEECYQQSGEDDGAVSRLYKDGNIQEAHLQYFFELRENS